MFVLCQCVGHVPWISRLRIECPGLVPLGAPSPHWRSVHVVACIIRDVATKVPRRNPPRPTDNEQHVQHTHTHQCASCASRQRPTWPATCASINVFATVGGDERPTHRHASPCPIRWCGRHQLCTAPPAFHTWRQHHSHVCQHLRPRKLRGHCAWPKSVPP